MNLASNCSTRILAAVAIAAYSLVSLASAEALLPDLVVQASEHTNNVIDTLESPGRTLLRFQSSLPNIGPGEFIIRSTFESAGDNLDFVQQEIRQSDGSPAQFRPVDGFLYNTATTHMDCFDWVAYRIREILPGDGVGEILRSGQKPSVRLVSSRVYDSTLPNYVGGSQRITFSSSQRRMGISVGWTDIYSRDMPLQSIDITGLKQGEYWIEVEVDYGGYIQEANEDNNVGRIKILLNHESLPLAETHRADTGDFGVLELSELLRVIQLFNGVTFECAENTEDGFNLGGVDHDCQRHSSDFVEPFWTLSLSELLRTVQLFNLDGYVPCEGSEDGFCAASI